MPCPKCENKVTKRTEEDKKAIITRLNRISGQINGIKGMVESDRYCDDILIQIAAIDKSIKSLASLILEKHLHSCVISAIKGGDESSLDEIVSLFKRF